MIELWLNQATNLSLGQTLSLMFFTVLLFALFFFAGDPEGD